MISVIIIDFKKTEMTKIGIESLKKNADYPIEIILIENESTSTVNIEYADIVIRNKENIGFIKAVNQGIEKANGEYILLWNNDAECRSPFLKDYVDSYTKKIGIIGPSKLFTMGTDFIEGSCFFFSKKLYKEIGKFDERFGIGVFEDVDFCLRAKFAGYELLHKQFNFYHPPSTTFGIRFKIKTTEENRPKFTEKWFNKRKKPIIAHFCNQLYVGGIEEVLRIQQKNIGSNYEMYYFTISEDTMGDELRKLGGNVLTSPLKANAEFCSHLQPDIIIFHTAGYVPVEADYLKETCKNSKKCIVIHSPAIMQQKPDYIDCIVSVSETVYNIQHIKDNILIKNGVDTDKITRRKIEPNEFKEWGIEPTEVVVGRLSRIAPDKLITDFILTAQRVLSKCANIKFMVVGEHKEELHPGYIDKMKLLVAQLGMEKYFIFTGVQRDLQKYLSMMDIMLNPTMNEAFGMVFGEAMCAELPVATYDLHGNRDSVKDGYNGFLVEGRNTQALADKVIELAVNKEKRLEMGKNSREFVETNLSGKNMAKKYATLYKNLLI